MAARTILAHQRQLERELKHRSWLEQNLQHSTQLAHCQQRIQTLRVLCAEQQCEQNADG